jgi:hypothetical protein
VATCLDGASPLAGSTKAANQLATIRRIALPPSPPRGRLPHHPRQQAASMTERDGDPSSPGPLPAAGDAAGQGTVTAQVPTTRATAQAPIPDSATAPATDPATATAAELAASIPALQRLPARGPEDDLPVVARLIVEIRSDGSRTIARGAIEDTVQGQRVSIDARGDSPLALALALARSIGSLPRLSARAAVRGLLDRRKK